MPNIILLVERMAKMQNLIAVYANEMHMENIEVMGIMHDSGVHTSASTSATSNATQLSSSTMSSSAMTVETEASASTESCVSDIAVRPHPKLRLMLVNGELALAPEASSDEDTGDSETDDSDSNSEKGDSETEHPREKKQKIVENESSIQWGQRSNVQGSFTNESPIVRRRPRKVKKSKN
jgi:hypothetical protein